MTWGQWEPQRREQQTGEAAVKMKEHISLSYVKTPLNGRLCTPGCRDGRSCLARPRGAQALGKEDTTVPRDEPERQGWRKGTVWPATGLTNTSMYLPSQASVRKGLPHRWNVHCPSVPLGRLGELSPPEVTVQALGEWDHHYLGPGTLSQPTSRLHPQSTSACAEH